LGLFVIRWWIRIVVWVALGRGWARFPAPDATFGLFLIQRWIRIVVSLALRLPTGAAWPGIKLVLWPGPTVGLGCAQAGGA
jgi:hypothetical protein